MKDTLIFLSMSSVINYDKKDVCRGVQRLEQYVAGLKKFFECIEPYNNYCDVLLFDNTVDKYASLHDDILPLIPDHVIILHDLVNKYGPTNKGAGIIEQWMYCKKHIGEYQWFVHFEPRQLLTSAKFFESFFKKQRTLFKHYMVNDRHYFWTGLFAVDVKRLLGFCTKYTPNIIMRQSLNLENITYDYIFREYDNIDVLDLVWYDYYTNRGYDQ